MNIIIKQENYLQLEKVLRDVQKKCRTRIIEVCDLELTIEKINKNFEHVPKKYMEGMVIECDIYAFAPPRNYKGTPYSTIFKLLYKYGEWRLFDVDRYITKRKRFEIKTSKAFDEFIVKYEKEKLNQNW